jgi:hypothetical protein
MTAIGRPTDLEADDALVFDAIQRQAARVAERIGPCPEPRRLLDARDGRLSDGDANPILAHASACPFCQALVEAVAEPASERLDAAQRRRLDGRIAAATSGAGTRARLLPFPAAWRWGTLAAISAAASLLLVFDTRQWLAPGSVPMVPPAPAVGRFVPPSRTILLAERLETRDMGLASLSWRGDATAAPPFPAFDAARDAFDRGDFAEAERRLDHVTGSTPALADAWLLLGVARLLLGRPADAVAPLSRAHDTLVGDARDDAGWHLAVALRTVGRAADARALLAAMCTTQSPRAAMACLARDELGGP